MTDEQVMELQATKQRTYQAMLEARATQYKQGGLRAYRAAYAEWTDAVKALQNAEVTADQLRDVLRRQSSTGSSKRGKKA